MANTRAILFMTIAMACFATSDAFINIASDTVPTGQLFALTCAFSFAVFFAFMLKNGDRLFSMMLFHRAVMIRTMGEVFGSLGYVMALTLIPLTTASAMLQTQPLVVTMAAALFLGEKVGPRRWFAVGVGFFGVLLIIRPGAAAFDPNILWTFLGILGLTARDLGTRMLPKDVSTPFVSAWALIFLSILGLAITPLTGEWQPIDSGNIGWVGGISIFVVFAFIFINGALRVGEVSAIAPFRYTRMVFALMIAVLFLGERPDMLTLIGIGLIVGSGIYAFLRERRLARAVEAG
ncbi:DMT family transporter [Boseongicola aestuarii]|jgi:drug/metabolite transporter (DMT)-like permease|uniref:EamA-like transporter family protein n=1 Tax=Boseongicola aestuarii TaxID=1470561 RepID=A0A238J1H3_9RHOB|nr:DMT family transporter [Boseongicola aestuarii]SMX24467.1 EamA-like transporter family protein [Boseongicola aestuarii]